MFAAAAADCGISSIFCRRFSLSKLVAFGRLADPVALFLIALLTQSVADDIELHSVRLLDSGTTASHSDASLPPESQAGTRDIYLARGMKGRIDCPLKADPPHTLIVWIKENRPLAIEETGGRLKVNQQGSLLLRKADESDQGTYACVAYSPLEKKHSSPLVHVRVKDLPYFTVTPKPFYQKQLSQVVHMPCIASGDPLPAISWQKISGRFPVRTRILQDGGNLTIARLTKEDEGLYQCLAVNLVASIVTTSLLLIEVATQHGPTNVTVTTTAHTATVSWHPAYDGGRPVRHAVCCRLYRNDLSHLRNRVTEAQRQHLDDDWERFEVPSNDVNVLTVHSLQEDMAYQFIVLSNLLWSGRIISSPIVVSRTDKKLLPDNDALTTAAPSNESIIRVETVLPTNYHNGGSRPHPPASIRVKQVVDGLLLSWTPPEESPVPVAYYSIEYRTVGQWVPLGEGVVRNATYLWKTSSRGVTYHFRVTSYGRDSQPSKPSDSVTFNTGNPSEVKESGSIYSSNGAVATVCVVVAVLLLVVAVYFATRLVAARARARATTTHSSRHSTTLRYENVKYSGSNNHGHSPNALVTKGPALARSSLVASVMLEDVVSNSVSDHSTTDRLHLHGCSDHEHDLYTSSNDIRNHREVIQVEATV